MSYTVDIIHQQVFVRILPPLELCMSCSKEGQTVDCIFLNFCGTLGMLKTVWFRIYANNLIDNYKSASNDYLTIKDVEERIIMREHAFAATINSFPLLFFSYFSCIVYTITPLMNYDEENYNVTDEIIILEYPISSKCTTKYLQVLQKACTKYLSSFKLFHW